jgi:hypothetical protein
VILGILSYLFGFAQFKITPTLIFSINLYDTIISSMKIDFVPYPNYDVASESDFDDYPFH